MTCSAYPAGITRRSGRSWKRLYRPSSQIGVTSSSRSGEPEPASRSAVPAIPLLPEFVDANTATGRFAVERDRYVDG